MRTRTHPQAEEERVLISMLLSEPHRILDPATCLQSAIEMLDEEHSVTRIAVGGEERGGAGGNRGISEGRAARTTASHHNDAVVQMRMSADVLRRQTADERLTRTHAGVELFQHDATLVPVAGHEQMRRDGAYVTRKQSRDLTWSPWRVQVHTDAQVLEHRSQGHGFWIVEREQVDGRRTHVTSHHLRNATVLQQPVTRVWPGISR
jgi:hypothetical protein